MATIVHDAVLGELEFDETGWADATLRFASREILVNVTFQDGVDEAALRSCAARLVDLHKLDQRAQEVIAADLAAGDPDGVTLLYCRFHRRELDDDELRDVLGVEEPTPISDEAFLPALRLVAVSLQPEDSDDMIVCDYSIGEDVTDHLIAVTFDASGDVGGLSLES